jgi:hypothetical protein
VRQSDEGAARVKMSGPVAPDETPEDAGPTGPKVPTEQHA